MKRNARRIVRKLPSQTPSHRFMQDGIIFIFIEIMNKDKIKDFALIVL